jgi:hypothetical protein
MFMGHLLIMNSDDGHIISYLNSAYMFQVEIVTENDKYVVIYVLQRSYNVVSYYFR